eukprot:m.40577 g.40577  ORF g.40577 m.40577 type:complete len:362 (+) comp9681_c0_seq1:64-1149(+)
MVVVFVLLMLAFTGLSTSTTCESNMNCSLNGVCNTGNCVCDHPWTGPSCATLKMGLAKPGGMYGYSPNVSSWGGSVIRDGNGTYHLYVAEMKQGGLKGWGHFSECTHAVSTSLDGPYKKHDEAISPWCHNPAPIMDPKTGKYLLFHIGTGPKEVDDGSGFMHYSSSPTGPWTPAPVSPGSCNNPAPAFHPNGTLFVICNHMDITHTDDWMKGPWSPTTNLNRTNSPLKGKNWEDPFLWFDKRGNWHILYHVYCMFPYTPGVEECYSGHLFSTQGHTWTYSEIEPFNGTVSHTDGTSTTFSTRERPKIVFDSSGNALGVITGVSSQPIGPSCTTCNSQTCSQCKVTEGRDWTYTVYEPFQTM